MNRRIDDIHTAIGVVVLALVMVACVAGSICASEPLPVTPPPESWPTEVELGELLVLEPEEGEIARWSVYPNDIDCVIFPESNALVVATSRPGIIIIAMAIGTGEEATICQAAIVIGDPAPGPGPSPLSGLSADVRRWAEEIPAEHRSHAAGLAVNYREVVATNPSEYLAIITTMNRETLSDDGAREAWIPFFEALREPLNSLDMTAESIPGVFAEIAKGLEAVR
jgi:hypothetical protein